MRNACRTVALFGLAIVQLVVAEAAAETAPPGSAPEQELFTYTVREGDSCEAIAEQIYGQGRYYYIIVEYNPGPSNILRTSCDNFLEPGMSLRLPRRIPQSRREPDARIAAVVRKVRSRPPTTDGWSKAQPGQRLFRGWRVNTLEKSEAQLTFRDESAVHLREETLVIIYGPTASDARRRTSKAILERGTLRARLGELSGRTRLKVETPSAVAALNGGEAVVSVDEEETSRVSNHTGRPAEVANRKGGGEVLVSAGMGTTVRRGKRPEPPRPLLPAPRWVVTHPTLFVTLGGAMDSVISGAWQPVTGATHYRVELSSGPDGEGPVGSTGVPANISRFELRGFPPDSYHLTVASLDEEGLESTTSPTRVINLVELDLVPPSYAQDLPSQDGVHPRVMAGTSLSIPQGLTCSLGEGEPGRELVFSGRGVVTLNCQSADRQRAPRMLIEVVPLELRPRAAGSSEPLSQLSRGDTVTMIVDGLDTTAVPPSTIAAVGGPGLRVDGVEPGPGDAFRVTVTVAPDAPPESYVELQLRPPRARRVVLGRLPLGIDAALMTDPEISPRPEVNSPDPEPHVRALTEPMALIVGPSMFGVRDERRRGTGFWSTISVNTTFDEPETWVVPALGLRLSFLEERLRFDVGVPVPMKRQLGGLNIGTSSRIAAGEIVGAAVELGLWLPFGVDERANQYRLRLVPSADLSFRAHDRVTVRTRQGVMADASEDGLLAWASAYAVDVWIVGPLTLGAEATLLLGAEDGDFFTAPLAGIALGLEFGPLAFTFACRYGFTNHAVELFGRFSATVTLRTAATRSQRRRGADAERVPPSSRFDL